MSTHPSLSLALTTITYLTLPMRKVVLTMCQLGVTCVLEVMKYVRVKCLNIEIG